MSDKLVTYQFSNLREASTGEVITAQVPHEEVAKINSWSLYIIRRTREFAARWKRYSEKAA